MLSAILPARRFPPCKSLPITFPPHTISQECFPTERPLWDVYTCAATLPDHCMPLQLRILPGSFWYNPIFLCTSEGETCACTFYFCWLVVSGVFSCLVLPKVRFLLHSALYWISCMEIGWIDIFIVLCICCLCETDGGTPLVVAVLSDFWKHCGIQALMIHTGKTADVFHWLTMLELYSLQSCNIWYWLLLSKQPEMTICTKTALKLNMVSHCLQRIVRWNFLILSMVLRITSLLYT